VTAKRLNLVASVLLIALIGLCLLWESWLAPLRPGGSWLILKALPLLAALFGVLHGRRYTFQWLSMVLLLYVTEGIVRLYDGGLSAGLAAGEIVLAVSLFLVVVLYARMTAPSRRKATSPP